MRETESGSTAEQLTTMAPSGVVLPESSTGVGDEGAAAGVGWLDPRISFSVDFVERDQGVPLEPASLSSKESCSTDFEFFAKERKLKKDAEAVDYSAEFEFCMCTPGRDPLMTGGSADELFYQGKLLPLQIPPRLGMLEYMAHDAEPVRFVEDGRISSQRNSQILSTGCSPYATPALSPGDSGHLSAAVSAAVIFPDSLSSDALAALPSSPASASSAPAIPLGPVLPTCYTTAPESPPSRVASCLPSTPFRHSKSFRWKGLFGSFMKMKTEDEGKEEVLSEPEGNQLERTDSRRRSLSRRLSLSLRRAVAGHDVTDETSSSSDLSSSSRFDFLATGKANEDGHSAPVVGTTASQVESCSAGIPDHGCGSQSMPDGHPSATRSGDPTSAASSLRTCSSGSAAQSLDELTPSNDNSGELIGDVQGAYGPARRAKHSRWIVLSCGLRGSPRFRGSQGTRLSGLRSSGGSSPTKLAVKVGDVDCSGTGPAKIVLKNLECVTSPTKGCTKVQEQVSLLKQQRDVGYRSPEKLGSYSASVRVMPVLNVPLCNLGPAFRAAQSSSRARFPSFRHIFFHRKEKDVAAEEEAGTDVK